MKHPLEKFKFCPKCGTEKFIINDEKSKKCSNCNFIYYFNSSTAVVIIIENEKGELLVAKRANNPCKGMFDFPGGFVDLNETAEEAVYRELKEETGLQAVNIKYLFSIPNIYNYSDFEVHTIDMFFYCNVKSLIGIEPKDDVADLYFINKKNINADDFAFASIKKGIEKLKKEFI